MKEAIDFRQWLLAKFILLKSCLYLLRKEDIQNPPANPQKECRVRYQGQVRQPQGRTHNRRYCIHI